jgi:NAD(P)-dependent dehydrogenase (short-subunit alcohol dehydrogenase family)
MTEPTMILTGGSVGIGRATAARGLEAGMRVISLARRPCPVDGVLSLEVDLSSETGVNDAIAGIRAARPELANAPVHMVHNAAAMPQDSLSGEGFDAATFERCMRLNVVTPAQMVAELTDALTPGSSIVYIGSTLSEKAVPGRASYVASKHAVVGLMRSTVQDLFGRGIHSVCVCPGFTDTEMLRPVLDANPGLEEAVVSMVSFGRLLTPEEIADVVLYATRTPALNGAILHANLGQREA